MVDANDTLSPSPTEREEQMPWLYGTNGLTTQHLSDPFNTLILQHPSDPSTRRPTRSSGIFHLLKARQNAAVTSSRAPAAETMTPQLSAFSPPHSPSSPAPGSPPSPTSPTFSDLTPTPEGPTLSPTTLSRNGYGDMELLQSDSTLTDPEALPSEMTTAIDGEARISVDEAMELSQERTTEFEDYTTQVKEASRQEVDSASAKDSGVEGDDQHNNSPRRKTQIASQVRDHNAQDPREDMAEAMPEAMPSRDQTVSQEHRPEAQNEGADLTEAKPEATPLRLQAAWVTEAVAVCQANKKNLLNKGDVLVILEPTDLSKSCLLDANTLRKTSGVLEKLYEDAQAKSEGCVSEQGELTAILALSSASSASIPELFAEALDATIESVLPPKPNNTGRPRLTRSAKIKAESDQGDSSSDDDSEMPKTDWPKAYESFFRILAGSKKNGIPKHDLSAALPQIQGVVDIALRHDAVHAVQSTFDSLFLGYVGKDTFWKSISEESVACIKIAVALRNRTVYDEAFKHLVGHGASFKHGIELDGVPDDVKAIIEHRSRDLYLERRDIEDELTRLTLPGNRSTTSSRNVHIPTDYPSQFVSQHNQPIAYSTVNLFRDWITEHIGHLRLETEDDPPESFLCDHATGCDSVAGFFRTIKNQTYLYPDEVWNNFNSDFRSPQPGSFQKDRETMAKSLEVLKAKAANHAEEISECTLRLTENVGYLTCVTVEREDVPWDFGSEEDSEEGEGMDEDFE